MVFQSHKIVGYSSPMKWNEILANLIACKSCTISKERSITLLNLIFTIHKITEVSFENEIRLFEPD